MGRSDSSEKFVHCINSSYPSKDLQGLRGNFKASASFILLIKDDSFLTEAGKGVAEEVSSILTSSSSSSMVNELNKIRIPSPAREQVNFFCGDKVTFSSG